MSSAQAEFDQREPSIDTRTGATFALFYTPGPRWLTGRPIEEQDLDGHRDYMAGLYAQGRVLFAGPFLDNAGGGMAIVRASNRNGAMALLVADPAIEHGVYTGKVRSWQAVFG